MQRVPRVPGMFYWDCAPPEKFKTTAVEVEPVQFCILAVTYFFQNRQTWYFTSRTKVFASTVFSAVETRLSPEIRNLIMNLRITTDEKVYPQNFVLNISIFFLRKWC